MTTEEQTAYEAVEQARADGKTVKEACKEVGVSLPTYYKRKRQQRQTTRRNGAEGRDDQEWTLQHAPLGEANPTQEQDRLRRTVAAQGAILSSLGIFVTIK